MRWGMHKWFLAGMFASGVITVLLALIVETVGAAAAMVVAYLVVSSFLLWLHFRRRGSSSIAWRSRELRCKWPHDATLRLRRTAQPPPRRSGVLVAID
jgi:hypothetical protein